jgi:hypothetical protein
MEKIIHFSIPERAFPVLDDAISRARKLHPQWEVRVWRDPVAPEGFLLERYWPRVKSGAQLSDLLRLDIVYKYGGVYVDGDLLLLKPLDELIDRLDFFIATEDGLDLTNAIFGARKQSPVIKALIDDLIRNEPDWSRSPNTTTGPFLFSRILQDRDVVVLPRESFYAYSWFFRGEKKNHRHSYGEHLWLGSWKTEQSGIFQSYLQRPRRYLRALANAAAGIFRALQQLPFLSSQERAIDKLVAGVIRGGDWVIHVGSASRSYSRLVTKQVGRFGRFFVLAAAPESSGRGMGTAAVAAQPEWAAMPVRTKGIVPSQESDRSAPAGLQLDAGFPIDLPIKVLSIGAEADTASALAGARRLLERRCVDFVVIKLPRGGPLPHKSVDSIETVLKFGYGVCTPTVDGSLTKHGNLAAALASGPAGVVLAAQEQYTPALALTLK